MECANCPTSYPADSDITLNPHAPSIGGPDGPDALFTSSMIKEQIDLSSPLMYGRVVDRNINLNQNEIKFNGLSEMDYLENTGTLDDLYDEGDKTFISAEIRLYGTYDTPIWAQELGSPGMTEKEDITLNFHLDKLNLTLDGSLLHIGDVLKLYDNIHGWKWYEIYNAKPFTLVFGKYMMWQIDARKTDLEGYIELEVKEDLNNHDDAYDDPPPAPKPRPRIY